MKTEDRIAERVLQMARQQRALHDLIGKVDGVRVSMSDNHLTHRARDAQAGTLVTLQGQRALVRIGNSVRNVDFRRLEVNKQC